MDRVPACIDHAVVAMEVAGASGDAVLTTVMRDVGGWLVPPGETVVPSSRRAGSAPVAGGKPSSTCA